MLKIHFLNVGHGDCIILEFPSGRTTMIDINNATEMEESDIKGILEITDILNETAENSAFFRYSSGNMDYTQLMESFGYNIQLENPVEYFEKNIESSSIFRFISTHPHMDHISGLSAIKDKIKNFWVTDNNYDQDEDKLSESKKNDWAVYKEFRSNFKSKVAGITVISPKSMNEADFYTEDGINVLAPNDDLIELSNEKNKANILSTVIVVKYGDYKFVFGGDAESDTWKYIYENHKDLISDATILKASHHGRDSGYHMESVRLMNPEYTIVSVGKKPDQDASNKYRNFSRNVFSTRWKGNIVFTINDDGSCSYSTQHDR